MLYTITLVMSSSFWWSLLVEVSWWPRVRLIAEKAVSAIDRLW